MKVSDVPESAYNSRYSEFGGFFISLRVHPSHPYIGAFTDPPIHSGTINIDH